MRKTITLLVTFCLLFIGLANTRVLADWQPPTAVKSNYVYLINSDTGTVIYQKNAQQKIYPASMTKVMTALVVMNKYSDNDIDNVTVTVQAGDLTPLLGTDAQVIGLKAGEQMTVRELLQGMLTYSGNDAAMVLARQVGGDVPTFVKMMNDKAKAIGAKNTHFVNPHGLQDPDHYTTAEDMYLIAKNAMTNTTLKDIVNATSCKIPATNKSSARSFNNTNGLLLPGSQYYYKYAKGIKTGYTSQAGSCLASYAQNGGMTYFAVVAGGPRHDSAEDSAFLDSKNLYQWVFGNFEYKALVDTETPQDEIDLRLAWNKTRLQLVAQKQFNALIPSNLDKTSVKLVPKNKPAAVMAPVKKGQKVCTADVMIGTQKFGSVNLVANESVERSAPLYFLYLVQKFFGSKWFIVTCAVLVAMFAVYILLSYRYNRKQKARNRRRKHYKTYR